ncbi:MAG: hypothetical protein GC185_12485 [Alphaproteobacteria bacterium]|nr:hypothetical protein [Alphaproteobacteria bacterium]
MTEIDALQTRWNGEVEKHDAEVAALQAQIAPMQKRVEAFEAEGKPGLPKKGLVKGLSRVFKHVVTISPLKMGIENKQISIYYKDKELGQKASGIAREVGVAALKDMPDGEAMRADYKRLSDTSELLEAVKNDVKSAIATADDAGAWEGLDMATGNKGIGVASYLKTGNARDAIKRAVKEINMLQGHLENSHLVSPGTIDRLGNENNLGLVADMLGGVGGALVSYANMQSLSGMANKLATVRDEITQAQNKIGETQDKILQTAIADARKREPAVNDFCKSLNAAISAPEKEAQKPAPSKFAR